MALVFYDTLTKSLQPFTPLHPGEVRMYTCGPTVYNFFHIGNARSFVMSDVIRRYFEYRGYKVTYVMNITDIDDKIIKAANEEGVDAADIATRYAKAFLDDAARFGIRPADVHPRATESIADIIAHIEGLIAKGAAYEVDGDVYFQVNAFPEYGKLSGKNIEDLQVGARVEADTRKRNPVDFALWKAAKPGEPWWESPWGNGRPGWHIECSVMSQKFLGQSFDIHAGGNDLIFPHHENEIAQSEALTHAPFARYWLHFGFLNVDNEKMSKSLGNFFTARDILDKYSAEALRFFYLQTHYRSPLNFVHEGLDAARTGLQKLQSLYDALGEAGEGTATLDVPMWEQRFIEAVDNDFNTPAGMGVLFEFTREANARLHSAEGLRSEDRAAARDFLTRSAQGVFGIVRPAGSAADGAADALVEQLMELFIALRTEARKDKQWALSDRIRDGLAEIGVLLEDSREGTRWKRKQ
ncbi:MAG TPA: cysteine--tRNA ligase [Bacteroidota bacterium]|nr:cysteine--tRNA ligase [Bacteroidota bacterium]